MALPACFTTREELSRVSAQPKSRFLPYGPPSQYFAFSRIKSIFETNDRLREVYLCECPNCARDSRLDLEQRQKNLNSSDVGNYTTIHALLIWHHRAGLIHHFQRHRTYLDGSTFFNREDLEFLCEAGVAGYEAIISDILRDQYSFQVRVLKPYREHTVISSHETLPIVEDDVMRGRGDFGQVYGFEFPYDEYRAQEFREGGVRKGSALHIRCRED